MRRYKVIIVLVVIAAVLALYFLLRPNLTQARQGVIELTNLPDQYCPLQVAIVVTDPTSKNSKALIDTTVAVDECRYITLSKLATFGSEPRLIFVKLPTALAFRVSIDSIKGRYQYAPSLGDVNGDNIIDLSDENQITSALFSADPLQVSVNDLDQDRKITVLDLSLTRINHRAGVGRPDGRTWGKI
ncbi:MAG: hypothetical protein UX60_C0033G0006 [Berkelbacteria bacterium GW2011_GWA2_46_7]|uniref:Dockerin domain-containing protein n=1 Tax=Berkelbacteria bacterium GW2011_GWA2_46_7 TaxID=1618335 RepID=A0A0G1TCP7_9BACT|nr:MAG: hypothetical protein UX60_C0033G0006 [Berkelbacteria bacterium GW2011_GWA2_46_7]